MVGRATEKDWEWVRLSCGRIEGFGDGEELVDGVPVTRGAGSCEDAIEKSGRELGTSDAVRKVNIEFPALNMEFFGTGIFLKDHSESVLRWMRCKKAHKKFGWFDVGAFGEGIVVDDAAEIGGGAKQNRGAEAEFALEGLFDFRGQAGQVGFIGVKDNVAALDVRLDAAEFQGSAQGAQSFHFDDAVAADVYAAKEADDGGWRHWDTGAASIVSR